MKERLKEILAELKESHDGVCQHLWENPEVSGQEAASADYMRKQLEAEGFEIHNTEAMPHAFYGEFGQGGPVLAFLGEYDALPGLSQEVSSQRQPVAEGAPGHGCGHNLIGSGNLTAAIALARYLKESGKEGRVRFYGCPEEEDLVGKVKMIAAGLFEGCDVALTWHPSNMNLVVEKGYLASAAKKYHFKGLTAHAAAAPENGRSALDGVELMNVGANYLREHVIESARIHYTLDTYGSPPNIVPDKATAWYVLRAPQMMDVKEILTRLDKIAQGGALMSETEVTEEVLSGVYEVRCNKAMTDLAQANLEAADPLEYTPEEEGFAQELQSQIDPSIVRRESQSYGTQEVLPKTIGPRDLWERVSLKASTDVGDVSFIMPTIFLNTTCWPVGVAPHTWQATAATGSSLGRKGSFLAAQVLAGVGFDILTDPKHLETIQAEFQESKEDYEPFLKN